MLLGLITRRKRAVNLIHRRHVARTATIRDGIEKKGFERRCQKTIHTEHADRDGLNDLSGLMIGCVFAMLHTLGPGFLGNAIKVVLGDAMHQL